jgi:hypothetical protein
MKLGVEGQLLHDTLSSTEFVSLVLHYLMNVTLQTITHVQPAYELSAGINLGAVVFGYPLNLLILVIGFRNKWARKGYQVCRITFPLFTF